MWTQIRLAERQGLLTGRELCAAQVSEVYLCELRDRKDAEDERLQQFRYALLSTGHISVADLFPELFTQEVSGEQADLETTEDQVTYRFDDVDMSENEMERELQQLMAGGQMTVRGGDLIGG